MFQLSKTVRRSALGRPVFSVHPDKRLSGARPGGCGKRLPQPGWAEKRKRAGSGESAGNLALRYQRIE